MKKTLAVVAVLATALTFATAKKSFSMTAGVRGNFGLGLGTALDKDITDDGFKLDAFQTMNMGGGLFLNFPIASGIGIQPEVNYNYNTIHMTATTTNDSAKYKSVTTVAASYSTIDIPVNVTYKFDKFTFLVGPVFTIPVGNIATVTHNETTLNSTTTKSDNEGDLTLGSNFIMGMDVGLEYSMRIGMIQGFGGVRYNLDFMPMKAKEETKNSDGSTTTTYEELATRRTLAVTIGARVAL